MKTITRALLLYIMICFFSATICAQNTILDSLKVELQKHATRDSTRVNLLNELAYYSIKDIDATQYYLNEVDSILKTIDYKKGKARSLFLKGKVQAFQSNYKQGTQYYKDALQVYESIGYKRGISECYDDLGIFFFYSDLNQSIDYYKKSLEINKEVNHVKGMSKGFLNIGMSYLQLGNYSEAISNSKKALKLYEQLNDEKGMSNCFNLIGSVYIYQANYPLANEYLNKSLFINKKIGDSLGVSISLTNIGIINYGLQNYEKAIEAYNKALLYKNKKDNKSEIALVMNNLGLAYKDLKEYRKANIYFNDALSIFSETNNKSYLANCLNNMGDVHLKLHDPLTAYEYFNKGKKVNLEVNNELGLCNSYLGIAKSYADQHIYDKALVNALKSKEISNKLEVINYQRDVSELLSEIYKNTNQYKDAFENHQQFKILNDSLFNKENVEKITQLEYEYKYKQQLDSASIRELKLTKTVKDTSQNLERSQRNYLGSIIVFLLISIVLGGIIFYLKFRNIKAKTHSIIVEQKLLRSQMTPHFIFNSLSVLQGMILNKEEKKSVVYLSKFSKLLRIILENSRDKVVPLSQELEAVENYLALQNLENNSYTYTVSVADTVETDSFEIPPMLIQPFVENAIEHAFTSDMENKQIDVSLKYEHQKLVCTIIDNGLGINSQHINKRKDKTSLATTITSERLKILAKDFKMEGAVTIENRQTYNEQGTLVTLVIPYMKLLLKTAS